MSIASRNFTESLTALVETAADDVESMSRAELYAGILYAAEILAKSDLAKTYGRAVDPDDQDAYEQKRRHHWLRVLLAGSPRPADWSQEGEHGKRWVSRPEGAWTVTVTADGTDVTTDSHSPLTAPERRNLADALLAVDVYGGELGG